MNSTTKNPAGIGELLAQPAFVPALIGLAGVILGIFMGLYLAHKTRAEALADKQVDRVRAHRDLVRLYADPMREAVRSLRFRLDEIVDKKQGQYLRADAPAISFFTYKRVSTLYRLAALMGWIRAMRRERSYLDPEQASASEEMQTISELEVALADGDHVEMHRLDELSALWQIAVRDGPLKVRIGNLIDAQRARFLAEKGALGARDLSADGQAELAESCAQIVREQAKLDIPAALVAATADQAAVIFGIKEAYIYRDWQAAIGDMMLEEAKGGARHFTVMGFGTFEDLYVAAKAKKKRTGTARWFDRLEALVHDLDMEHEGAFDARRDQVRRIHAGCKALEAGLDKRIAGED